MKNLNQFIIYRNLKYQDLFDRISCMLYTMSETNQKETMPDSFPCANQLVELAAAYGLEGNLWHCFLALCLADNENAYSTSCEVVGEIEGTINSLALADFAQFMELFRFDLSILDGGGSSFCVWDNLKNYRGHSQSSKIFNKRVCSRIIELSVALNEAEDKETFHGIITSFYRDFGVGKFGLNKAFRVEEEGASIKIEPIINVEHIYFDDLVGYELQKKKLIDNTEAFIQGKAANNVLLFGDSGTGKSSCIKAALNEYYEKGLRIIEVYKHQFQSLSGVLEQIKDRNYKYIIYMDDLSFEDYEVEYKYLKAMIEGGLGKKPQNVLIYATSNRRHLIREKFSDKRELSDDLHENDTVQEKLSLVARFGVTIYFGSPDKKEFQKIVKALAERYHIEMAEEELLMEANRWELHHGGLSGRTAAQFITYLLGK